MKLKTRKSYLEKRKNRSREAKEWLMSLVNRLLERKKENEFTGCG